MKDFFKKYKFGFIAAIAVFVILSAFTVVRFIQAEKAVKLAIDEKKINFAETNVDNAGWNIPEIQKKEKEVHWMEQQLLLAKTDSLNLGINLADSTVQVLLKGTVLLQANILKQLPEHFSDFSNYPAYLDFTSVSKIVKEQSTSVKRPVKKVRAPKNENEVQEVKHDTIPEAPIIWQFVLNNNIEIVITGVGLGKDSLMEMNFNKDILKYKFEKLKENVIPKTYMPTLYIWLNDKDAKAIYRAIPGNGRVVFKI
ncbi:MAG TPA: hypothetical protein P5210_03230 [Draconibacterium sp.]|mgnify:CR=1 FL=1|nr:hypothetical protein [Draconibacterium sp.]HRX10634.1 hypothetical protein [Draconibacterium sp.]